MDFRKVFDTIPEKFDKWRPHYCAEAFDCVIDRTALGPGKSLLEIGPGTGQATEPLLKTGCAYLAIELGEHLAALTKSKFSSYDNFRIVNADFETHDFGGETFDVVFSAAAIQWIPEAVAFSRSFDLLKSGGTLAMMLIRGDYKSPDEALFADIQRVYSEYFHPELPYTQRFNYAAAPDYGFDSVQTFEFMSEREFTADDYAEYIGTHSDHIVLCEPERSKFFEGIHAAILAHGNRLRFRDTVVVRLARKP